MSRRLTYPQRLGLLLTGILLLVAAIALALIPPPKATGAESVAAPADSTPAAPVAPAKTSPTAKKTRPKPRQAPAPKPRSPLDEEF